MSGSFTPRVYSKMRFLPLFRRFQALIGYGWYKLSPLVLIVPKMAYFCGLCVVVCSKVAVVVFGFWDRFCGYV